MRSGSVGTSMRSPSSTSLSRCSSGTPSMWPSTRIGIGPAISSTKSNSPFGRVSSSMLRVSSLQVLAVAVCERARREVAREHAAPLRVQRRIGLHEVAARLEDVVGHRLDQRGAAVLRRVDRRVLEHLHDVVVARHAPEAVAVGLGVPEDRRLALQQLEHVPGLALGEHVVVEQVDVGEGQRVGRHAGKGTLRRVEPRGGTRVKAVRYRNASGEFRIGRLEDESIVDAGPAGEQGFVPTREAWAALAQAEGQRIPLGAVSLAHPVVPRKLICIGLNYRDHAEESELDIPAVPGHLRQVDDLADRPRRDDRDPARGDAARLRGRARGRDRRAGLPRDGRRGARRDRAPTPASTTSRGAARSSRRRSASSPTARASTRSGRSGRASSTPRASTSTRCRSRRSSPARRCRTRTRATSSSGSRRSSSTSRSARRSSPAT